MKLSLKKLCLSFIVPSHYTFMFQINFVTTPFSHSVKMLWLSLQTCHSSVNLLFSKATYRVPNLLCISASIKNVAFTKTYCIITSSATVHPFFHLEVAMATAVVTFCKLFFSQKQLLFMCPITGMLLQRNWAALTVLPVPWASPHLPPSRTNWCISKNVMYIPNLMSHSELAG